MLHDNESLVTRVYFQFSPLKAMQSIEKNVVCVRFHAAVQRPGRVSGRRRHTGVRNVKIAEEVSSRKEHHLPPGPFQPAFGL